MNRAAVFEAYVKYLWPLHRKWAVRYIAKRCARCIASERYAPLNPAGVCATCASLENSGKDASAAPQRSTSANDELHSLLSLYERSRPERYDAIVLYSGGKDSAYLIHRIKRDFPRLRLLAITIDNTFMSPYAMANVRYALPKLGVDHRFIRPRDEFMRRLFRYAITHLNEQGCYGTVDFSDGEFLLDTAQTLAATERIPLVLCGYSKYQVEGGLNLQSFEYPRSLQRAARTHVAGLALKDIFEPEDRKAWWDGTRWPDERIPRLIFPLYAWDVSEDEIRATVQAEQLLEPGADSPILTNHDLIPLCGVVDVHRFGYASFEPEFARMVRDGRADPAVWRPIFEFLEYTSRTGLFVKPLAEQALIRLGLSRADVGIKFGHSR